MAAYFACQESFQITPGNDPSLTVLIYPPRSGLSRLATSWRGGVKITVLGSRKWMLTIACTTVLAWSAFVWLGRRLLANEAVRNISGYPNHGQNVYYL